MAYGSDGPEIPYTLTQHAADVIAEREIGLGWVVRVLRDPLRVEGDREDADLLHSLAPIAEFGGRVLRVVYNPTTEPWTVVTAFFDRRERPRE